MKHTHHIIPRHMGGTDDPTNLVELTIEEHAEAHRILYEKYGLRQDYAAWQGLLKLLPKQEFVRILCSMAGQKNKGRSKPKGFSENLSKRNSGSGNPMYGKTPWNKGKSCPASLESKIKKGRPIIFNGIQYYGILEAARQNNTSEYFIRKSCTFI